MSRTPPQGASRIADQSTLRRAEAVLAGSSLRDVYRADAARNLRAQRIPVEPHIHAEEVPDVARSIVDPIGEPGRDLIVMCTHGQGGLRGRIFGSIAQHLVAFGRAPVLLVRPAPAEPPAGFACGSVLVPLDQDPEHEKGFPVAVELARRCRASLHVLMVATPGRLFPGFAPRSPGCYRAPAARSWTSRRGRARVTGIDSWPKSGRRGSPPRPASPVATPFDRLCAAPAAWARTSSSWERTGGEGWTRFGRGAAPAGSLPNPDVRC